jgi:type III secretory pathway component EscV
MYQSGSSQMYKFYYDVDWEKDVYYNNLNRIEIDKKQLEFERYIENDFKYFEEIKPKTLPLVFNILTSDPSSITFSQIQDQIVNLNKAFANEIGMPLNDFLKTMLLTLK